MTVNNSCMEMVFQFTPKSSSKTLHTDRSKILKQGMMNVLPDFKLRHSNTIKSHIEI